MSLAMVVIAFVGKGWKVVPFGQDIPPQLLVAMGLLLLGVLVFAAVAVTASTRLGQVMTLLVCCGFFLVGSMSQYLFGRFAGQNLAARVAYGAWPNLTFYYALDAMITGRAISGAYAGLTAAYAACNVVAILGVGMALFQRRELEAQGQAASAPALVSAVAWIGRAKAVLAGMAALVVPSYLPALAGVLTAAGLLGLAVLTWLLWGWFGRGLKWTYFVVLGLALTVLAGGASWALGAWSLPGRDKTWAVVGAAAAGLLVLILLLPRTRHHFGLFRKRRGKRLGPAPV
jgi:hypothetical protein